MKKDIKYIIKRVIIAVLVILIVGTLNKCSVKADSPIDYGQVLFPGFDELEPSNSIWLSDATLLNSFVINNYNIGIYSLGYNCYDIVFTDNNGTFFVLSATAMNVSFDSINFKSSSYELYFEGSLIGEYYYTSSNLLFTTLHIYSTNENTLNSYMSYISNNLNMSTNSSNYTINNDFYYNVLGVDEEYNNDNTIYLLNYFDLFTYFNNNDIVYSSTSLSSFKINGEEYITVNGLNYYINGNYGNNNCNYFISDSNMCNFDSSNLVYSNVFFINNLLYNINLYNDLTFYNVYSMIFKIKGNYYNNDNYAYFIFYTKELIEDLVKIDINIDENTGDITFEYYGLSGQLDSNLFYVNSYIIQGIDSDDYTNFISPFYKWEDNILKISYSTDNFVNLKYNLNFFQSFDLYYSDVVFVNVNGTAIEDFVRLRTYGLLDDGFQNGGGSWADNGIDSDNNNSNFLLTLFNIVKRPLKLFKDVSSNSCQNIKATLPFVNSEFYLPCMSGIYRNVLGGYFQLVYLVINGLLIYRIGINGASAVKDIVDPTTDRIAVMDL